MGLAIPPLTVVLFFSLVANVLPAIAEFEVIVEQRAEMRLRLSSGILLRRSTSADWRLLIPDVEMELPDGAGVLMSGMADDKCRILAWFLGAVGLLVSGGCAGVLFVILAIFYGFLENKIELGGLFERLKVMDSGKSVGNMAELVYGARLKFWSRKRRGFESHCYH